MSGRLLVVEHQRSVPPARLGEVAAGAGIDLAVVRAGEGEPVPTTPEGAAGLVVLGGEMGVEDAGAYPHLLDVMELIRRAAARSVPVLGICLGAQLAAHALGGRAYPGRAGMELGWVPVELTPAGRADPVTGALGTPVTVFHWHRDTFDPPPGAVLLATGGRYRQQAFRLGSVLGVQFHPEVDAGVIAAWIDADKGAVEVEAGGRAGDLLAGVAANAAPARRLLEAFCRVAAAGRAPSRAG